MNVATDWLLDSLMSPWVEHTVPAVKVCGINLDSRLVSKGDLYLAVAGSSTHGIHYAIQAVTAGAVAVALSASEAASFSVIIEQLQQRDVPVLVVNELELHTSAIASRFYNNPDQSMKLIAVTGTDGKTSVCRFISQALRANNSVCGYIGTLGWGLGDVLNETALTTPDGVTLRRMLATLRDQGAQYVALEASSHGIAEGRLNNLSIDVAVLTNLGRDHLDYHITEEAYRAAKEQLFDWKGLQSAVLNADDVMGRGLLERLSAPQCVAYSSGGKQSLLGAATVLACNVQTHDSGLTFELVENADRFSVSSRLLGRFNVDNLLACYACLRACGVAANDACHGIEQAMPVAGRMERLGGGQQPTVVIDYCHTPGALQVAIEATRAHCAKSLWVVFGCGGDRDTGKRIPMAKAAEAADRIILTDDNPRTENSSSIIEQVMSGFTQPASVTVISDREQAIRYALVNATKGDLILVAGKGHEDYQIVGTERLQFSDREVSLAALELAS